MGSSDTSEPVLFTGGGTIFILQLTRGEELGNDLDIREYGMFVSPSKCRMEHRGIERYTEFLGRREYCMNRVHGSVIGWQTGIPTNSGPSPYKISINHAVQFS